MRTIAKYGYAGSRMRSAAFANGTSTTWPAASAALDGGRGFLDVVREGFLYSARGSVGLGIWNQIEAVRSYVDAYNDGGISEVSKVANPVYRGFVNGFEAKQSWEQGDYRSASRSGTHAVESCRECRRDDCARQSSYRSS